MKLKFDIVNKDDNEKLILGFVGKYDTDDLPTAITWAIKESNEMYLQSVSIDNIQVIPEKQFIKKELTFFIIDAVNKKQKMNVHIAQYFKNEDEALKDINKRYPEYEVMSIFPTHTKVFKKEVKDAK